MSYLLHTMMSIKRILLIILSSVCLFFVGCKEKQTPVLANCGITGSIQTGSLWHSNGVKVSVTSLSDASRKYVVISDENGKFQVKDIEADSYLINAVKEGYEMDYIVVDGKTIIARNQQKIIDLKDNETRNIDITMSPENITTMGQLAFTDLNGNLLTNIVIPKNASTISLRLFNGTQSRSHWQLRYDGCFGSIGFDVAYIFSSFNISEGILESGDNVTLIGYINPDIFLPEFSLLSSSLYLYDSSINSREYSVSIGQ